MALQDFERETVFSWDNSSDKATITTYNRALITKLDKFCVKNPTLYKLINEIVYDDKVEGKEYSLANKKLITIKAQKVNKKELTEKEKKSVGEKLRKAKK